MEKALDSNPDFGRKRFWILFAVWVAAAEILPFVFNFFSGRLVLLQINGQTPALFMLQNIFLLIAELFAVLGSGVMIFTAAHYCFKRCMWLVLTALLLGIGNGLISATKSWSMNPVSFMSPGLTYGIALPTLLLNCITMVLGVAMVRLFVRLFRKEWVTALCSAGTMMLLSFANTSILTALTSLFGRQLVPGIQIGQVGLDISFSVMLFRLLYLLFGALAVFASYTLLHMIFTSEGRKRLNNAGRRFHTLVKKAWDATAR